MRRARGPVTPSTSRWLALSLALSLTGCSGDDGAGATGDAADSGAGGPSAASSPGPAPGSVLQAVVGSQEQPDAYEISLTDERGAAVERLAPGSYTIEVRDLSRIHNFHLEGPGVDKATSVAGVEDATFEVTLEAGEYEFRCDPHPGSMRGSVTVA